MPRDHQRERSASPDRSDTRKYRDRSDAAASSRPKRKVAEVSPEDAPSTRNKKIQLPARDNKYPSVNDLKRRIRDVKRLLNRVDLAADARIVQERALAGYEKELADEMKRRDRSKMIKKYHFVRFLDRKNATKELNKLVRREEDLTKSDLEADVKEKKLASLAKKLHVARVNLNYTIYYPLNEKYIAICAEKKKSDAAQTGDKEKYKGNDEIDSEDDIETANNRKIAMWKIVEKCMEAGTLDLLRDGKLDCSNGEKASEAGPRKHGNADLKKTKQKNDSVRDHKPEKPTTKPRRADEKRGKDQKHGKDPHHNDNNADEDDESDGGFFEM